MHGLYDSFFIYAIPVFSILGGPMKKNIHIIILCLFVAIFSIFSLFNQETLSYWERRKLEPFPKFSWSQIQSGRYTKQMDAYINDHFILRPFWLRLSQFGWGKQDVILQEHSAILEEYPLNRDAVHKNEDHLESIAKQFKQAKIAIIPDKAYFLKGTKNLRMDYDSLFAAYSTWDAIPIHQNLKLSDYYLSDPHWKMDALEPIAQTIAKEYGVHLETFNKEKVTTSFLGQQGLYTEKETIYRLMHPQYQNIRVQDIEHQKEIKLFDASALTSMDPYSYFLYGPLSMVTLENDESTSNKELVIFRDSFSSSIAPLFATGFKKVTLIDIRKISYAQAIKYVDIENAEALFLFSASTLNSENIFK